MIRNIILASKSGIRKKILEDAGFEIKVEISNVDEDEIKQSMRANNASCVAIAKSLAEHKANRISSKFSNYFVLGADQVLDLEENCISKPKNDEEAKLIIKQLNGKTHKLHSAVCVSKNGSMVWHYHETSSLKMKELSDQEIENYLKIVGTETMKKYGVYQIESEGKNLFETIDGDTNSILGMPIIAVTDYFNQQTQ
jgi:septum formation protein